MPANLDRTQLEWAADTKESIGQFNAWWLSEAVQKFDKVREDTRQLLEDTLRHSNGLLNLDASFLASHPESMGVIRMVAAPPIARERLAGMAEVDLTLLESMERKKRLPPQGDRKSQVADLTKVSKLIEVLADRVAFPWLATRKSPTTAELERAALLIADRYCLSVVNPLLRNAQEERQLKVLSDWLTPRGYTELPCRKKRTLSNFDAGDFATHVNVPALKKAGGKSNTVSVDLVVKPRSAAKGDLPLFIEAKSAGDFTNTNKRQKEEASKMKQLQTKHGPGVSYVLFLCGYFGRTYLQYEKDHGIDWVWEHRPDDLSDLGL